MKAEIIAQPENSLKSATVELPNNIPYEAINSQHLSFIKEFYRTNAL